MMLLPLLLTFGGSALASYNGSLAFQMVGSTIARGQGIYNTAASTSLIELGIFQQALRESIAAAANPTQRSEWEVYLNESTTSAIAPLSNATADAGLPLDRFSIGSALIQQYQLTQDPDLLSAIDALQASAILQQRNANGGLWYYANPTNLSYYHNLSYLDGMFSYPSFAVLSTEMSRNASRGEEQFRPAAALEQFRILYNICKQPSGLLVHGYDASKAHNWSNPVTGASPNIWGRSLSWYTLGALNTLELLEPSCRRADGSRAVFEVMKELFSAIAEAQIKASERSFNITGNYGVWQVVDRPGESGNFLEASASCMTVYSLLRGARKHFIAGSELRQQAIITARGIYQDVRKDFLIDNSNGTLSLSGTSSVASLSGESVDYEYYITRPTETNSLIGTSAFILASLEIEQLS